MKFVLRTHFPAGECSNNDATLYLFWTRIFTNMAFNKSYLLYIEMYWPVLKHEERKYAENQENYHFSIQLVSTIIKL